MDQRFRLHFNDSYAPQEHLDRVAEILVEQELDGIWEAKIKFEICLDDQGSWEDDVLEYFAELNRGRIEIKLGDRDFIPLIDGPVIGQESSLSSEPGTSTLTLIIADDSILLNQQAVYDTHEGSAPHEIATTLFNEAPTPFAEKRIDPVESVPDTLQDADVQNETHLQFLRRLGRRHNRFVFFSPGDQPGDVIAHFSAAPGGPESDTEALVLLGSDRNLQSFNVEQDSQQAREITASSINLSDKTVLTRTSEVLSESVFTSQAMQGIDPATLGLDFLPAGFTPGSPDPQEAVDAQAGRSRYQFEATGSVIPGCFKTVLSPFLIVNIQAGQTPLAGHYLVKKVTHRIDRNQYTQDFTVMRDSALATGTAALPNIF